MHEEGLYRDLTQSELVPWQKRHHDHDNRPQRASDSIPVRNVDILGIPLLDSGNHIPDRSDQTKPEDYANPPQPLAILLAVVETEIECNGAQYSGEIKERKTDPCEALTVEPRARTARCHEQRKSDQRLARPGIKCSVGVDRPQPSKRQRRRRRKIRIGELEADSEAHGRGQYEPDCRRRYVSR